MGKIGFSETFDPPVLKLKSGKPFLVHEFIFHEYDIEKIPSKAQNIESLSHLVLSKFAPRPLKKSKFLKIMKKGISDHKFDSKFEI